MHTHDDDVAFPSVAGRKDREAEGPDVATQHALAAGDAQQLGPSSLSQLQRLAGNESVEALISPRDPQRASPVLDVVGSGGQPLPGSTRHEMEAQLGHDFGDVRLHTDSKASDSAKSVQALAYTVGNDIVLREGLDPESSAGKHTLAHELTHVVQQRSGAVEGQEVPGGIRVSDPTERFEREAEATAERVMTNPMRGANAGRPAHDAQAAVQRTEESRAGSDGIIQRVAQPEEEEKPEEPA